MYGRKVGDKHLRPGTPLHLYLPSRPGGRGVFNLQALKASKEIILCEALIDALTFWCAGFRNVTSAYGVAGFTEEMRDGFVEHGIENVLIAYDRDEAGDRGAEILADRRQRDVDDRGVHADDQQAHTADTEHQKLSATAQIHDGDGSRGGLMDQLSGLIGQAPELTDVSCA